MRPWIEWSAGIGLAVACVMFTGCAGGGVPDPGSDSAAAADSAPETGEPPAPAPPGGKAAPLVAQNKSQAPSAPKEDADADDKKDAAQASGENTPAAKSEGGSATAEMLAMATGGQTGSGGSQPPAGGGAAPGQSPQPGGGAQAPAQPGGPANQPGASNRYAEMMRARAGGGGQGGYPGGSGSAGSAGAAAQGPGGLAQDNGPADTRTPEGAVCAFLNALQAKDRDRLAEATALRAQTEASTDKTKELFGKIVDLSISDAEIDDLAKKLQGFRISGGNAPKSTGRLGIYIDKPTEGGSVLRVTLTVRKEKKGWGVMDMSSNPIEFKPMMGNMNQRRRTSGRGGP